MKKFFTLSLSFNGETLDNIPISRQGFSLANLVGAKGKHATQTCKLKIQDRNSIAFILKATDFVFAKVFNGEQCIYEGIIKPYLSMSASQARVDDITLSILDYTEILDKEVFLDLSKYEGKINVEGAVIERKWKDQTVDTILRDLFAIAGISDLCTIDIKPTEYTAKKFSDFRIVDGDNLHDVIDNLCYESFLDYRFAPGVVHVFPTDVFTSEIPINDYRLRAKVGRGEDKFKGVKVSYQKPETDRIKIYHEDNRFDDAWNTFMYHRDYTGYYYEHEMHNKPSAQKPTKFTARWNFSDLERRYGKVTVISVKSASMESTLHDEKGVSISSHLDDYDETGGCAYVYYDGRFNDLFGKGWGFEYDVYGTVRYKREYEIPVTAGLKPKKIQLKYVEDLKWARRFGVIYQQRQQQNVDAYEFTSAQQLIPGDCYLFNEESTLGISATIRILSSSYNYETKLYTYKAEGANELQVLEVEPAPDTGSVDTPPVPSELDAFFYLTEDRNLFMQEESTISAKVNAHGFGLKEASQIDWLFNGSYLDEHEDQVLIPVSEMKMGNNAVTCRIIINTEPYECTANIIKTSANNSTIIQYRWGKDPLVPPLVDSTLWMWGGKIIFHNGKLLGNLDSINWRTVIAESSAEYPYLWMRVSADNGGSWAYTRLPGKDDVHFQIESDRVTYPYNARGAVVAATTVKMKAVKTNTIGSCTWQSIPKLFEPITADQIEFTVPVGFLDRAIEIRADIEGLQTQYLTLYAQETGTIDPVYVGNVYTLQELQSMATTPGGMPWATGDHAIITVNNEPVPYVYDREKKSWGPAQGTEENFSEIFGSMIYDIVNSPNAGVTNAAIYGFFKNLAANNAFIERLFANYIKVQKAIYGGDFTETGVSKGDTGFHLGANGQLQAVNANLSGAFTCSVMETVLNEVQSGSFKIDLKAENGTRIVGIPSKVEEWARKTLPAGTAANNGIAIEWSDGTYQYEKIRFISPISEYRYNPSYNYWFGITDNSLDIEVPVRGIRPATWPFMKDPKPLYSENIDYAFCNGEVTHFNFPRVYFVSDIAFPELGRMVTPYHGTIILNGESYISSAESVKYLKISNGNIAIYDSNRRLIVSMSEFQSCSMDITYSTTVIGLRAKTIYPYEPNEAYYVGLPDRRYKTFFGENVDCQHIFAKDLPTIETAEIGELYVDEYNNIKIRKQ